MMRLNSLKFKGRILFSIILFCILILFSGGLFVVIRQALYRDLDEHLQMKAKEFSRMFDAYYQVLAERLSENRNFYSDQDAKQQKTGGVRRYALASAKPFLFIRYGEAGEDFLGLSNAELDKKVILGRPLSEGHPLGLMSEILNNHSGGLSKRDLLNELWRSDQDTLGLRNDIINIFDPNGRMILTSGPISTASRAFLETKFLTLHKEINDSFKNTKPCIHSIILPEKESFLEKKSLRVIHWPLLRDGHETGMIVQIGTSMEAVETVLEKILIFMLIGITVIIVMTSFLGEFFVRKILNPMHAVTSIANRISMTNLSFRIPVENTDIELRELIQSFNSMVKRLESSFGHVNEFSSHVAHEMKTPLAIIRGEIELALDQDRSADEYKNTLRESLDEIDRLTKVIKDLLLLAKLDYKPDVFKFEQFNLIELIAEVFEHSRILGSDKNIRVSYHQKDEEILVFGDRIHLRRLFLNLIDNAIRYTPDKGEITVNVIRKLKEVEVIFSDTGEGMSQEDLSRIFDKFFRVRKNDDPSNHNCGLGLNICASIARAHHGRIEVSSQLGRGSSFTVILPIAATIR